MSKSSTKHKDCQDDNRSLALITKVRFLSNTQTDSSGARAVGSPQTILLLHHTKRPAVRGLSLVQWFLSPTESQDTTAPRDLLQGGGSICGKLLPKELH